ncbi:MAG: HD domain-containing protein [Polyangiales bacterium]
MRVMHAMVPNPLFRSPSSSEAIPMTLLTARFADALSYAATLHNEQVRKQTAIPYVAHLLGTASIALDHGATEDEAIGALLHDAIEDQSHGGTTAEAIRAKFGPAVLAIVQGCTDAEGVAGQKKPDWRPRKEEYIAHVAAKSDSTRLVSACDKLHNARAILADFRVLGDVLWTRFTGRRDGTLWYYRALVTAFRAAGADPRMPRLVDELDRTVTEIERLARAAGTS